MNKNFIKIAFLSFFISSCSLSDMNRDNIVQTTSSAAGGYLGYHLSDGDIFSTTVGSSVGLIIGKYLSDFIGQDDYYFYKTEALKTLEKNDNEKSITTGYWKNPKSGNRGVIKIKGHFGKPECRLIEHIFINKRKTPSNAFDTACRQESGQWAMIK